MENGNKARDVLGMDRAKNQSDCRICYRALWDKTKYIYESRYLLFRSSQWKDKLFYYLFLVWITFHLFSTETSVSELEEAFQQFTNRSDIAILLINQNVRSWFFFFKRLNQDSDKVLLLTMLLIWSLEKVAWNCYIPQTNWATAPQLFLLSVA